METSKKEQKVLIYWNGKYFTGTKHDDLSEKEKEDLFKSPNLGIWDVGQRPKDMIVYDF